MVYVYGDDFREPIPIDEDEDTSDWLIEVEKALGGQWLEDALLLNPYLSDSEAVRDLVKAMLDEVSGIFKISSPRRSYDSLKAILLSLWVAHLVGTPVRYSRRKNDYVRGTRYGKIFFKFDRILPLVDALESLDYIKQRLGWRDERTGIGRLSRMWGTNRLWSRFRRFGIEDHAAVMPPEPEEFIVLRDEQERDVAYRDTPDIREQREQLQAYNEFVKRHSVTVDLPANCKVDNHFLTVWQLNNLLTNRASLIQCLLRPTMLMVSPDAIPVLQPLSHYHIPPHYLPKQSTTLLHNNYYLLPSITDTDWRKAILAEGLHEVRISNLTFLNYLKGLMYNIACRDDALSAHRMLREAFMLKDIGVDRLLFRMDAGDPAQNL
jgi:hypothetical protein